MNRREAIAYNEKLKKELNEAAVYYGIDKMFGDYLVDNYITVIPNDARRGMIAMGEESKSYKLGNIRIDLKNALVAGLEFLASINQPESVFNYIQLLIVSCFFIERAMKIKIEKTEAYVVYLLHMHDAYNTGINEETLIMNVREAYREQEGEEIGRDQIDDAINRLYEIKVVDFESGNVFLIETVWMKNVEA